MALAKRQQPLQVVTKRHGSTVVLAGEGAPGVLGSREGNIFHPLPASEPFPVYD